MCRLASIVLVTFYRCRFYPFDSDGAGSLYPGSGVVLLVVIWGVVAHGGSGDLCTNEPGVIPT